MYSKTIMALIAIGVMVSSGSALAQSASCHITEKGKVTFNGKCNKTESDTGSFNLANINQNKPLTKNMHSVSVILLESNQAMVRAYVTANDDNGTSLNIFKRKGNCYIRGGTKICTK